jgi:prolyl-tRNA synthetase
MNGLQVVIVPIWKNDDEKEKVLAAAVSIENTLKSESIRVKLDALEQRTPGWKFNFWEMKVFYS